MDCFKTPEELFETLDFGDLIDFLLCVIATNDLTIERIEEYFNITIGQDDDDA